MNIMYASDDKYVDIAATSIVSILENNRAADKIKFFILDNGITSENKAKLALLIQKYLREIVFIDVPDMEKIAGVKLHVGAWALAAFARLFASSLLPSDVGRIIYLDCDTMIRSSLLPLWNENLNGKIIGGCEDGLPVVHKKTIFLDTADIYVNSGILLIDMNKWREKNAEQKLINFLLLFEGRLRFPDQDVINGVFKDNIKLVPPKYNSISYYYEYNPELLYYADIKKYYTEKELSDAKNSAVIVHFAGPGRKPWTKGNVHIHQDEYTRYRNLTPWAEVPLGEPDELAPVKAKSKLPQFLYRIMKKRKSAKELIPLIERAEKLKSKSKIKLEDCYIR